MSKECPVEVVSLARTLTERHRVHGSSLRRGTADAGASFSPSHAIGDVCRSVAPLGAWR
jgi:hypothetical protein